MFVSTYGQVRSERNHQNRECCKIWPDQTINTIIARKHETGKHISPRKQPHVRLLEVLWFDALFGIAGGCVLQAMHQGKVRAVYPQQLAMPQAVVESAGIEIGEALLGYDRATEPLPRTSKGIKPRKRSPWVNYVGLIAASCSDRKFAPSSTFVSGGTSRICFSSG